MKPSELKSTPESRPALSEQLVRHPALSVALTALVGVSLTLVLAECFGQGGAEQRSTALFAGFATTALSSVVLSLMAAHAAIVTRQVQERTAELQAEIEVRVRLSDTLQERLEELSQKDERYRLVVEQTGQLVYDVCTASGKVTRWGDVTSILGYGSEEFSSLNGAGLVELMHPADRLQVQPQMEAALHRAGPFELSYRLRRKDGTYAHIFDRGVALADEQGQVRRILGTLADMSPLKRVQEATREHLRFLEALLDAIPNPVFYIDNAGRYRLCNEALAKKVLGLPIEDIVGHTLGELPGAIPAHLASVYRKRDEELLARGGIQSYEIPVRCSDGVEREFLATKAVFRGGSGEAQGIIGVLLDISERKAAEQALALSQSHLARAMELARLTHWEYDPQSDKLMVNDRFYGLHGTSAQQEGGYSMALEKYLSEFLSPEEGRHVAAELTRAQASPQRHLTVQLEHRIQRRDGQQRYVQVQIELSKEASGQMVWANGTTQDITQRRQAQEELKRLWVAVEQGPATVIITDASGRIEYVNQRFESSSGFSAQEVAGKNPRLLKSGFHPVEFYQGLWNTIQGGEKWHGEVRNRKKDGSLYWESMLIAPVRNQAGGTTHFIAIKEDISARKEAAEELARTQEALRQRETLLRTMTSVTPLAFYVVDNRTDEVLYWNQQFCDIWGLANWQQRLEQGQVKNAELMADCLQRVAKPGAFEASCKPLQEQANPLVVEDELEFADGRTLRRFSSQVRDPAGCYFGRLYLFEDISRRKEADRQLAGSLQEKEVLLREVYHRVKNNLQVISSLLNLQSGSISDPASLRLIRETQERVRSMALVHEKLYRAKDLCRIDFADYTRQLVTMLARSYRTEARPVEVEFELENLQLNLDTSVPCGLILNELVSNVFKYAFPAQPKGREPAVLRVRLRRLGEKLFELAVSDNGIGLAAHINPLNTSTLGLQVVSMLAEQLNGAVQVEREAGTTFRVNFREIKEGAAPKQPGVKAGALAEAVGRAEALKGPAPQLV